MKPYLVDFGKFRINGYGLFIGVGLVIGLLIAMKRADNLYNKQTLFDRQKAKSLPNGEDILDMTLVVTILGFLGAKLFFVFQNLDYIKSSGYTVRDVLTKGFVVYGGLITGVIAGKVFTVIKKKDFLACFDIIAPSLAFVQGFGRMGCLMAGCCYGVETKLPIGIIFKDPASQAPLGVRLFPTQPLSSIFDFAVALLLVLLAKKIKKTGVIASLYIILYAVGRFIIEFFRGDALRGFVGPLSTSQFISIFVLIFGLGLLVYVLKKDEEE